MTFETLPPLIGAALSARGYTALTPVQAAVIEPEAAGRDLIVSAQTGSGKTVAFGLAMADGLLAEVGGTPLTERPLLLVIAPTRELALQVSRELAWLYAGAGLRIATCVGGMDASKERRNLRSGPAIVVGTPGRLRDHLERGALDLTGLVGVVLDEADEMLDMGFREDLEEILDATPDTRRTLMFSATMPRPIEHLAQRYQKDALRLSLTGTERGHGDISYQAVVVAPSEIENAVVNLLRFHEAETAILFCATRDNVRHLHAVLQERGFAVVALSGEHSQSERNQALQALRDRRARVCVATDVAARGIDLPTLTLVVHVETPRDPETLQHRSGRTGRAGKKGIAALVVPFNRRRRVESLLRGARIEAEWMEAPSADAIREADRTRLMERLTAPIEHEDEDRALAAELMGKLSAEDIAAALVLAHRAALPAPEELSAQTAEARDSDRAQRHREGFEDTVWFRLAVGRRNGAEARWILPLICRRGHVTRNEIGAIKVGVHETFFQIPRALEARFADALSRTATDEDPQDTILIEPSAEGPRFAARENRRDARPGNDQPRGERAHPRPHRANDGARPAKPFKGKPAFAASGSGAGTGTGTGDGKPRFDGKPGGKPFFKGKPGAGKGGGKPFKGKPAR